MRIIPVVNNYLEFFFNKRFVLAVLNGTAIKLVVGKIFDLLIEKNLSEVIECINTYFLPCKLSSHLLPYLYGKTFASKSCSNVYVFFAY